MISLGELVEAMQTSELSEQHPAIFLSLKVNLSKSFLIKKNDEIMHLLSVVF